MPSNVELAAEVKKLRTEVGELRETVQKLQSRQSNFAEIHTLCEIVLELVEVSGPINQRHAVLHEMAQKLRPHIPKKGA